MAKWEMRTSGPKSNWAGRWGCILIENVLTEEVLLCKLRAVTILDGGVGCTRFRAGTSMFGENACTSGTWESAAMKLLAADPGSRLVPEH